MSLPFTEAQFLDTLASFNAVMWPVLALLWLASLGLAIRLFAGRPQARALGVLLALQWISGVVYHAGFFAPINPAAWLFAALFAVQALALLWYGLTEGGLRVSTRWSVRQVGGVLFILSALAYPGLALLAGLEASRAPLFGVPCPTVLFTTGVLLSAAPPAPRWLLAIPVLWAGIGGSAALLLGMTQDWLLLAAGAALVADGLFAPARPHRVRASLAERARPRVVDRFVTQSTYRQVLAIDIDARPEHIWPWLVQMGYQRGGLYSYDWLDRLFGYLDRPSANQILPAYQELRPGDVIPIGRGGGFPVAAVEPPRSLVLAGEQADFAWGWELALDEISDRRTRLVSRNLGRTPATWRSRAFMAVLRPAAFLMTHRMLGGIKRRAEALANAAPAPAGAIGDGQLDRFLPEFDIIEQHSTHVSAPLEITFDAACGVEFLTSPVIRAIVRGRELMLGSRHHDARRPRGLVAEAKAMGWGVLYDAPGREIVMGAVTRPWEPNVVFQALPPDTFASFREPGYVKIAWTLRADPDGGGSIARTETRALATDVVARDRFRRYWRRVWPGIVLIRYEALRLVKRDAERRARSRAA